jgi:hypothetical protein
MKCFNEIGEMKGKERFQEYLNHIGQKRKGFDDRFIKLSGVEKLRMAIEENEYFPYYNEQAIFTIEQQDLLLITEQERKCLYKRIELRVNIHAAKRWKNIKDMIESIDLPKVEDLPF